MQDKKYYVVEVDSNNIITELVEESKDFEACISKATELNENRKPGKRYAPFTSAGLAPTVGKNIEDECKAKAGVVSDESQDGCIKDCKTAMRMLMVTDLAITSSHQCPIPTISPEKAHEAIQTCSMLLMSILMMNMSHQQEKSNSKEIVEDLFKHLGLNTKSED